MEIYHLSLKERFVNGLLMFLRDCLDFILVVIVAWLMFMLSPLGWIAIICLFLLPK